MTVRFKTFAVTLHLWAVLLCCALNMAAVVYADPIYDELSARYLKLRNTDIQIVKADEWEVLGRKLLSFVDKKPKSKEAPEALFKASILYEQLYRRFGGSDRLSKCTKLFERLARDYPGHILVDDALVRRGDLLLYESRDIPEAKRSYQEVVQAYPNSDMFSVARVRLDSLENGPIKFSEQLDSAENITSKRTHDKPLIVIDPGHGGEDSGAKGIGGLMEKDVVLAVALELERLLVSKLGALVRLTRRGDLFVPLAERTNLANDFEADLFISLHTNASEKKNLTGIETYYLDNTDDSASRTLAERENASLQYESRPDDLQFILSDLIQSAKLDDSIVLAHLIQDALVEHLSANWKVGKDLGVKRAPFYVLVGAHMPCVLVEMSFIDHPADGMNLASRKYRKDLAAGIYRGVVEFLERQP